MAKKAASPKASKTPKALPQDEPTVQGALVRLGVHKPTGSTMIVRASLATKASPEQVWSVWKDLEKWPQWGKPLIESTKWLERKGWEVGSQFEETLAYGFPLGRIVSIETIREVNENSSVSWVKDHHGVKSCHIWFFEPVEDGTTIIRKTQVLMGFSIGIAKMFGARGRLQKAFEECVSGLARAVDRAGTGAAVGTASEAASS